MQNYKKNDQKFWFVYTRYGRLVTLFIILVLIRLSVLDHFEIIQL